MKVFCAPFMCLQFGFVIFEQKHFGSKAAYKMLVKLTPGHTDAATAGLFEKEPSVSRALGGRT